jgi:alkylation response protein AidB-like acyl-CoA dehydrogenase
VEKLLARVDEFVGSEVIPAASSWESERCMPRTIFEQAATRGLTGLIVPEGQGGQGLGVAGLASTVRKIAAADMACAFSLVVHNNLAGAIARYGSPYLKEQFLPGMLKGKKVGAFLLTEPQGGSDAGAIETKAVWNHDCYLLNGEKAWVSNGIYADVLSVYAQTGEGMLAMLVPRESAGVEQTAQYSMLGGHALGTSGFIFNNVRVPAENVLFQPGEGLRAALAGIDIARINVAAMCCGMLEASLDYAIEFSRQRRFKGDPVTQLQGIQWRIADIATDLAAADALFVKAATDHDENGPTPALAAKAKKFATRVALRRIADCMQMMGAHGLKHEHPIARHLACAKIAEYLDGTTEIQNIVISRAILVR